MIEHLRHPDPPRRDTNRGWGRRWSERARRRDRERADAELVNELRWQWRSVCQATPLSHMIYTPSGATRAIPQMSHVDLGPPISFTVRMRPGQTQADFEAAAPSLALALNAADLRITALRVPQLIRVVLLPASVVDLPSRWSGPRLAG